MKNSKKLDQRIIAVGERLKQIRIERGYSSYEAFAWEHNLSRMQYYRIEKGKNITMETLLRILDIYQLSFAEFFAGVHEKENHHKTKQQ